MERGKCTTAYSRQLTEVQVRCYHTSNLTSETNESTFPPTSVMLRKSLQWVSTISSLGVVSLAAQLTGCTLLNDKDGISEGPPADNSYSTSGCDKCSALEECFKAERCVAKLVAVLPGYSIDATEVTRSQYSAWLAGNPLESSQSERCKNNRFALDTTCMKGSRVCQKNCDHHPQPCVDWCDAVAYCKAIGRRLCGKIDGGPLSSDVTLRESREPTKSQWFNVCSSGDGTDRSFPYGKEAELTYCNCGNNPTTGCESGACTTVPVGSLTTCASSENGYSGIYDLIGNLHEWEDSCWLEGQTFRCDLRGGSFAYGNVSPPDLPITGCTCDYVANNPLNAIDTASDAIGFRCCSDP